MFSIGLLCCAKRIQRTTLSFEELKKIEETEMPLIIWIMLEIGLL